jgi:hypothetical protein
VRGFRAKPHMVPRPLLLGPRRRFNTFLPSKSGKAWLHNVSFLSWTSLLFATEVCSMGLNPFKGVGHEVSDLF